MKHKPIAAVVVAAALAAGAAWSQGWGPGAMMGGYGPGAGPGMMGGYGPGPGWGMMGGGGGYGYGALPDLTPEQRGKIAEIQRESRARQWPLMQQMHELMWNEGAPYDEQAQRREYDKVASLQKQMFENQLDTRKRIDAVLTPQQREQLRRGWPQGR